LTQGGKESVDIAAQHKPRQAGRQAGRKAGSKSDTKLTFSGFKLGEEILDRNSNRLFLNREASVTCRESYNKRRNSHKSEQKSRKEQHHSFQIARKHVARDTATSALHLFYFVAPSRASTNPLATLLTNNLLTTSFKPTASY
jgi:hypothetical protein